MLRLLNCCPNPPKKAQQVKGKGLKKLKKGGLKGDSKHYFKREEIYSKFHPP